MTVKKTDRERITIRVDPDTLDRARRAVVRAQADDACLTMQGAFDRALELIAIELEAKHPGPARMNARLKPGRRAEPKPAAPDLFLVDTEKQRS